MGVATDGTLCVKSRPGPAPSPWSGAAWNPASLGSQRSSGPAPPHLAEVETRREDAEQVLAHLTDHLQLSVLCIATCSKSNPQSLTEGPAPSWTLNSVSSQVIPMLSNVQVCHQTLRDPPRSQLLL